MSAARSLCSPCRRRKLLPGPIFALVAIVERELGAGEGWAVGMEVGVEVGLADSVGFKLGLPVGDEEGFEAGSFVSVGSILTLLSAALPLGAGLG
jgi:hypothetical protein